MKELLWIKMPKQWFRLEKDFTTFWLWELKNKWYWKKKWSDWSQDKKPYDADIVTTLWSYHCEIKIIEKDDFSFDKFQPNQIKALEHISSLWWNAIVVIYSKLHNDYNVRNYNDLKIMYNYYYKIN